MSHMDHLVCVLMDFDRNFYYDIEIVGKFYASTSLRGAEAKTPTMELLQNRLGTGIKKARRRLG